MCVCVSVCGRTDSHCTMQPFDKGMRGRKSGRGLGEMGGGTHSGVYSFACDFSMRLQLITIIRLILARGHLSSNQYAGSVCFLFHFVAERVTTIHS